MRRITTICVFTLLCLALASTAMADFKGFYGAAKSGAGIETSGDADLDGGGIDDTMDKEDGTSSAFLAGLALGHDFNETLGLPLRTELEYMYRSETSFSYEKTVVGYAEEINLDLSAQTFFVNVFVDWHNDTAFTPYLQGGLGLAILDYDAKIIDSGTELGTESGQNHNLAWNLGAGVAYELTANWSLDASYRYASLGKVSHEYSDTKGEADINSHDLLVGVRYTF